VTQLAAWCSKTGTDAKWSLKYQFFPNRQQARPVETVLLVNQKIPFHDHRP
jgi:hypothetical protein